MFGQFPNMNKLCVSYKQTRMHQNCVKMFAYFLDQPPKASLCHQTAETLYICRKPECIFYHQEPWRLTLILLQFWFHFKLSPARSLLSTARIKETFCLTTTTEEKWRCLYEEDCLGRNVIHQRWKMVQGEAQSVWGRQTVSWSSRLSPQHTWDHTPMAGVGHKLRICNWFDWLAQGNLANCQRKN